MDNRKTKNDLLELYNTWHENNKGKILNNEWNLLEKNTLFNPEKDSARGLNLIAYISTGANEAINHNLLPFIEEIIKNKGYIIPEESRHITILDLIPHNSNYSEEQIAELKNKYADIIEKVLENFNKEINIELDGVFISPDGITIQGFPMDTALEELRENLREEIIKNNLLNLEKNKYPIETAHISLVKFFEAPDSKELLEITENFRTYPMGYYPLNKLVLNISSRFDKNKTIEKIREYSI